MQRQGGAFPNSAGREHESPERHPRPCRSVPAPAPRPGPARGPEKRDPHQPRTWPAGAERRGRTPPLLCDGSIPPSPRLTRVGRSKRRVRTVRPVGRFTLVSFLLQAATFVAVGLQVYCLIELLSCTWSLLAVSVLSSLSLFFLLLSFLLLLLPGSVKQQ